MASKLEPHADHIFGLLMHGYTYIRIVESLKERGCFTNISNVREWLNRRAKKIVSRSQLINPPIDPIRTLHAELIPATSHPAIFESVAIKTTPIENQSINKPLPVQPSPEISSVKKYVLPPAEDHRTLHVKGPVISERMKFLDEIIAAEALANPNKGLVYTKEMADMINRSSDKNIK